MSAIARTRADVDVRSDPKASSSILDRLPADCSVEILADLNRWYKVKPDRLMHGVVGYLPQAALTFPEVDSPPLFPLLPKGTTHEAGSSVPASLKVMEFANWLAQSEKPGWISTKIWSDMDHAHQAELMDKIRVASIGVQPRWDEWLASLKMNLRFEEAIMNEWIVMMEGGRDVYAIRDHTIFMKPVQDAGCFGWALKGQIMHWNGTVRSSDKDGKRKSYYEVDFYRLSRYMHGWFRADIAADYIFPTPDLDPAIEGNAQKVFDLTKKFFRLPQDQVMADAKQKGYSAAQYIDVFEATKRHLVHFSLCGEFCVAALSGMDVLPLLKAWLESKFWRAAAILKDPQEGTSTADLQSLLSIVGLKGEIYTSIPTSPQLIKERLDSGQYAIVGCGINSGGKIKANGKIRHWVILEDIIPSGNSGWVRVYNPFNNQEEVYNYTLFMASAGIGAGLWIGPKD